WMSIGFQYEHGQLLRWSTHALTPYYNDRSANMRPFFWAQRKSGRSGFGKFRAVRLAGPVGGELWATSPVFSRGSSASPEALSMTRKTVSRRDQPRLNVQRSH